MIEYLGNGILLYCSCLFHSHTCWFASLFPSTFVVCQQARCKCLLNSWGWPLVTSIFTNYQQIVHNAGNGLLWIIASRQVLSISMTIEIFYFVLIYQTMFYHKLFSNLRFRHKFEALFCFVVNTTHLFKEDILSSIKTSFHRHGRRKIFI